MSTSNGTASPERRSKAEVEADMAEIQSRPGYMNPTAFGVGVARVQDGKVLDVWFPHVSRGFNHGSAALLSRSVRRKSGTGAWALGRDQVARVIDQFGVMFDEEPTDHPTLSTLCLVNEMPDWASTLTDVRNVPVVAFMRDVRDPIKNVIDAYFRLHLLSYCVAKPNEMNLNGIFRILPNVAWTSEGPTAPETLNGPFGVRAMTRMGGTHLRLYGVDKFPHMTDYVVPPGVRIADSTKVRLGAHLWSGTTLMHTGQFNFDSGTVPAVGDEETFAAMIEGRVPMGTSVGHSDVGGAASIAGSLSGGGKDRLIIGDHVLIGALAGVGISLGDGCQVEAGTYIKPGTELYYIGPSGVTKCKARELSGQPMIRYMRDSSGKFGYAGCVVAVQMSGSPGNSFMNADLHGFQS